MIRQIFFIAGQNFSGWHKNARVWMTFALGLVLCLMLSDQMITRAQTYHSSIQLMEPFIWTFGDEQSVLFSTLLLLLLFADMPFIDQAVPYRLIRTTRDKWLAGQILYVIVTVILYNFFLLAIEALIAMPWSYIGNVWSETSASFAYGAGKDGTVAVSVKTMEISTPYECAAFVFILMLLYSLLIAALMLLLNLAGGKAVGVLGVLLFNLYGYLLNPEWIRRVFDIPQGLLYRANVLCGWLSPLSHATFSMHNFGYDYLPGIQVSVFLFFCLICILLIAARIKMKRYNFTFVQVEE